MVYKFNAIVVMCLFIPIIPLSFVNSDKHKSGFKCVKNSEDYRYRLNTRTPYRFLANNDNSEIKFDGCTAKKIWFMIRHGARLPEENILSKIKHLFELRDQILKQCESNKNCYLSKVQIERLKKWDTTLTDKSEPRKLVAEGEKELFDLGYRYRYRFPSLIPKKIDNSTIRLRFTDKQRTIESARHFTIGLLGKEAAKKFRFRNQNLKDPILSFYETCDGWIHWVKHNKTSSEQYESFQASPIVQRMLNDLSVQLFGTEVTFETARLIYDVCSYETAWNEPTESAWCILTPESFKIFEFLKDLKTYWTDGYGYSLNYQQACPVLVDMYEFFKDDKNDYKISAYFSHTATLLKIFALLKIGQDELPLRNDTYEESENRNWRTSFLDTFATNLGFVLYDCQSGPGILVLHQERIVNLPGCPENLPCPLELMKVNYPIIMTENCDFQKLCSLNF